MKKSQNEIILEHIRHYGSITQLEATYDYGITRLAARISDLKDMGYNITSETETKRNRFGKKTRYSRYRLNEVINGEK